MILVFHQLLPILALIFISFNFPRCSNSIEVNFNCTQLDRSRKLRAFVLSGRGLDERYNSAKNVLVKLGFNVGRYEPPGLEDPRWPELYNKITEGLTTGGVGTYQGRRAFRKKAFLLSQAWIEMVESAFSFTLRHENHWKKEWLNDYTFFFEDDIAVHPSVQDPYCAIISSIEINPSSGVLYLGLENPTCQEHTVINGLTYGKGCTGPGVHAVGLRNSIAAPLIAAVRVLQGPFNIDDAFVKYSEVFSQSFWLAGSNLAEATYKGLFYQDRKKFQTTKPITNGTDTRQ